MIMFSKFCFDHLRHVRSCHKIVKNLPTISHFHMSESLNKILCILIPFNFKYVCSLNSYWVLFISFTSFPKLIYFLEMLFSQITIKLSFLPPGLLSNGIISQVFTHCTTIKHPIPVYSFILLLHTYIFY